jgi:hypothetical protein
MLRTSLAALILAPVFLSSHAFAYSDLVRKHCRSDYMTHCSQYSLGTEGLRACMRKVGVQLRPACVNALMESGEVARRKGQRRAEKH